MSCYTKLAEHALDLEKHNAHLEERVVLLCRALTKIADPNYKGFDRAFLSGTPLALIYEKEAQKALSTRIASDECIKNPCALYFG